MNGRLPVAQYLPGLVSAHDREVQDGMALEMVGAGREAIPGVSREAVATPEA